MRFGCYAGLSNSRPGAGPEDRNGDRLDGPQAILAHAGAAIE
jgi:hypothetical protein